jgi:AraC-like DNA-binding protein
MQHYTLEAIGQEAGFMNKMTLSRAFKKHCDMTPSEYRNEALENING